MERPIRKTYKDPKLRQLKLLQTMRTFLHSHSCSTARCNEANCEEMKASLVHFKECSRKPRANCFVCRQVVALTRYHAKHHKDCESSFCIVPFCAKMKTKLKENEKRKLPVEIIVVDDEKEYAVDTGEIVIKQEKDECSSDEVNYEPIARTSQFYETPGNPTVALRAQLLHSIIELMKGSRDRDRNRRDFEEEYELNREQLRNLWNPYKQLMAFHNEPEAEPLNLSTKFTQAWQPRLNPSIRVHILRTMISICTTALPADGNNLRAEVKVAIRRLEQLFFENANSQQEYENLITTVLGKIFNERF